MAPRRQSDADRPARVSVSTAPGHRFVTVTHRMGRWQVRAELVKQGGRLVVAELHITPPPGGATPPGGVTAHLLRGVPVGHFGPFAQATVQTMPATHGLARAFLHLAQARLPALPARPRPRRAVGRDDRFYAEIARDYLTHLAAFSRRPIQDLAAQRGIAAPSQVRDMVREARERGLLSMSQPGQRGGELLPRARALLAAQSPTPTKTRSRGKGPR